MTVICRYCKQRVSSPERMNSHYGAKPTCRKAHKRHQRASRRLARAANTNTQSEALLHSNAAQHTTGSKQPTANTPIATPNSLRLEPVVGGTPMDLDPPPPVHVETLQEAGAPTFHVNRPESTLPLNSDSRDAESQAARAVAEGPAAPHDIQQPAFHIAPGPPAQPVHPRKHGYAAIEVHPHAARVYRWHFVDEQPDRQEPLDELQQKKYFEICEWLMTVPVSNQERANFLNLVISQESLGWRRPKDILRNIDAMEHGPDWTEFTLTIETHEGRETFVIYRRSPLEVIQYLIRQGRFKDKMKYAPERHWTINLAGRKIRVYSEMWTGDWWWRLQNLLGAGATLAPFIIATDQTQMTRISGSKVAWPVYGSIGNISSHVRRRPSEHAMVLIGYLPVAKLNWITNAEERRRARWKLYHSALAKILEPLRAAAHDGVEMLCADGGVRRIHPILSTHLGDWPEMCLAGCCLYTWCPICVSPDNRREVLHPAARLRTKAELIRAFRYARQGYTGMQVGLGLRPTWPYWGHHPWASGPSAIVPDLLHQLWKGVFLDQIRVWWSKLTGPSELDQWFRAVPRYSGLRHFRSGLSVITQWTGNEARAIAKPFLSIIAGDMPQMAVEAARGVLDFLYRARQPQLDEDDLNSLDEDLETFHDTRDIFRTWGVYEGADFNDFAKMHMLGHYTHQIREWGVPDGYSTEGPERLHIEYVKIPYAGTSGVDPEAQMTLKLQRIEALGIRRAELERAGIIEPRKRRYRPDEEPIQVDFHQPATEPEGDSLEGTVDSDEEQMIADCAAARQHRDQIDEQRCQQEAQHTICVKEQPTYQPNPTILIAQEPTIYALRATDIIRDHDATGFIDALRSYLEVRNRNLAFRVSHRTAFGIYHKFRLLHNPLPFAPLGGARLDLVRAAPARYDRHGLLKRAPFFDTVLLEFNRNACGLQRYRAARVLVIFKLPRRMQSLNSEVLCYVELFDDFDTVVPEHHRLPVTYPSRRNGKRIRRVYPISKIRLACHLVPDFPQIRRRFPELRMTEATDISSYAKRYFLNRHINYYFFSLMDHWRRVSKLRRG